MCVRPHGCSSRHEISTNILAKILMVRVLILGSLLETSVHGAEWTTQVKRATDPTKCLETSLPHALGSLIQLVECNDHSTRQKFNFDSARGHLRSAVHPGHCLVAENSQSGRANASLAPCQNFPGAQLNFDGASGKMRSVTDPGQCLHAAASRVHLAPCRNGALQQAFTVPRNAGKQPSTPATSSTSPSHFHFDQVDMYVSQNRKAASVQGVVKLTPEGISEFCSAHAQQFGARCVVAKKESATTGSKLAKDSILKPWTYVGCFRDMPQPRAMTEGPMEPLFNTKQCQAACNNYTYFALQNTWCSCGSDEAYQQWGAAPNEECGNQSSSDPYYGRLGRNWRMAVYSNVATGPKQTGFDASGQIVDADGNLVVDCSRLNPMVQCKSIKADCGEALDPLCSKWIQCGDCAGRSQCLSNKCLSEEALMAAAMGKSPNLKELWDALHNQQTRVNTSAGVIRKLYPELYALEDLEKKMQSKFTQDLIKGAKARDNMMQQVMQAESRGKKAEDLAGNAQVMTKKALKEFVDNKLTVGKISDEELNLAKQALTKGMQAMQDATGVQGVADAANQEAGTTGKQINDSMSAEEKMQLGINDAEKRGNSAYMMAKDALAEVGANAVNTNHALQDAALAAKLIKEAHARGEKAVTDTESSLAQAKQGLASNKAALQNLLKNAERIQSVEALSMADRKNQAKVQREETAAMNGAAASAREAIATIKANREAAEETKTADAEAAAVIRATQAQTKMSVQAEEQISALKAESGRALATGAAAIKKTKVMKREATAAIQESAAAVKEGRVAVQAAKQAETAVAAVVEQTKVSMAKSAKSIAQAKTAEVETKKSIQKVHAAEKEAGQALGEAKGALVETKKTTGEIDGLTSQLHTLEDDEAKMEGIIEVLQAQSKQNANTMVTLEKHEKVMNKTLKTVKAHAGTLDKTIKMTSALTDGLASQQDTMDKHQEAFEKNLVLDQKQNEALQAQQKAMVKQTQAMNKTTMLVQTISETAEAHQTAIESHQKHLTKNVESTVGATEDLRKHDYLLQDTGDRLLRLAAKSAAKLKRLQGEGSVFATKHDVNVSLTEIDKHLTTAEANMISINKRTLAAKELGKLLIKHTNTLDANVDHMKNELVATSASAKANIGMLHTIEANEKDARKTIEEGLQRIGELHHQADVMGGNQQILKRGHRTNMATMKDLIRDQVLQNGTLNKILESAASITRSAKAAHDRADRVETKSENLEEGHRKMEEGQKKMQDRLNAAIASAGNGSGIEDLDEKVQKIKKSGASEKKSLKSAEQAAKQSMEAQNKSAGLGLRITDLEDKTESMKGHQSQALQTTAFGLIACIVAMFLIAGYMMRELKNIREKLDERGPAPASGSAAASGAAGSSSN